MKNKKNIKKQEMPKKKYFGVIIVVLLVAFAAIGVNRILGREVSLVCEDKKGNLFVPRDKDGKMDECGKHAEAITFKFEGGTESGGVSIIPTDGNFAFIDNAYVLKKDETVWNYNGDEGGWSQEGSIPVDVDNVLQWSSTMFLTKSGILYRLDNSLGWVTNNP